MMTELLLYQHRREIVRFAATNKTTRKDTEMQQPMTIYNKDWAQIIELK